MVKHQSQFSGQLVCFVRPDPFTPIAAAAWRAKIELDGQLLMNSVLTGFVEQVKLS